jgi:antitoxin HicB
MNYRMITYQIESDLGQQWVAEYPSLPGVLGTNPVLINAIQALWINTEVHLKTLKENGLPVPESDQPVKPDDYSGKLLYRTSKSTHRALAERAQKEGVSINSLINEAVHLLLGFLG